MTRKGGSAHTIPSLSIANIEAGLNQILTDIRNHVTVSVISMSFAGAETSEYHKAIRLE